MGRRLLRLAGVGLLFALATVASKLMELPLPGGPAVHAAAAVAFWLVMELLGEWAAERLSVTDRGRGSSRDLPGR